MKLKLIYNPAAGRGRARHQVDRAIARLRAGGAEVDVHASASPADLTRVAAESSRETYDRVVICGGDGSVHYALREFDLQSGVLGVIPLGSADDLAHALGLSDDLNEACDAVISGAVRTIDVATANGMRYAGVAGVGFDAAVAAFARDVRVVRGSAVYLYSILRVLPRFKPVPAHITIDRRTRSEPVMFAVVGNSDRYGGGIRIVPDARIDDGVLDYCIVRRTSRLHLLKMLPRAYGGRHVSSPFVETGRCEEFHLSSGRPLDVYADGEPLTRTPVSFRLQGHLHVAVRGSGSAPR